MVFYRHFILFMIVSLSVSCSRHQKEMKEQIRVEESENTTTDSLRSISYSELKFGLQTIPKDIIQTGLADIRLVTIHKKGVMNETIFYKKEIYDEDGNYVTQNFLPGTGLLFGYNLVNIAHFNRVANAKTYLFPKPVIIKSLYYPCIENDSIDKKPIKRDYFMVSVYDEDTNGDTLINKKDLRRLYWIDGTNTKRELLIPKQNSVYKSEYDKRMDAMHVFTRLDQNANGTIDKDEPVHIYTINLKNPLDTKLLYP